MRLLSIFAAILLIAAIPRYSLAQARVESNVVYGMYSGLALLMDVHHPATPNGLGIVFIPGSGWHEPLSFDAEPLKQSEAMTEFLGANALLDNGYTLFAINHRSAPEFRYPAAVEDANRAVRYIRFHANRYGIDPDRIGAIGHSSGGHLASMLGVLDGDGDPEDPYGINQESSKVQAVVAIAAITDLTALISGRDGEARAATSSFMGTILAYWRTAEIQRSELSRYAEASPTSYVSPDDAPTLLVHGDDDGTVPFSQSELFRQTLTEGGVIVELIRMPNGGHGPTISADPNAPDYLGAMVEWFNRHLRSER